MFRNCWSECIFYFLSVVVPVSSDVISPINMSNQEEKNIFVRWWKVLFCFMSEKFWGQILKDKIWWRTNKQWNSDEVNSEKNLRPGSINWLFWSWWSSSAYLKVRSYCGPEPWSQHNQKSWTDEDCVVWLKAPGQLHNGPRGETLPRDTESYFWQLIFICAVQNLIEKLYVLRKSSSL